MAQTDCKGFELRLQREGLRTRQGSSTGIDADGEPIRCIRIILVKLQILQRQKYTEKSLTMLATYNITHSLTFE